MARVKVRDVRELMGAPEPERCLGESRAWGARWRGEEHIGWPRKVRNQDAPEGIVYILHPACWKCGADMGCPRCSGPTSELLCNNCKDWGHPDALESHGRLLKTPAERAEAIKFLRSTVDQAGTRLEVRS